MALPQIVSLALVDAVNPCTLAVQILLLSALVMTKKRRDVFAGGVLFTVTVFIMYVLFGLGILQAIYSLGIENELRIVLKALLIIMAIVEINAYFSYKPGFGAMEMPMFLRPIAKKVTGSIENPLMAIPIAAACSFLLLPCSSGPYVAALMILSSYELVRRIPLLFLYNLLFTLPMIFLTFLVTFGTTPAKVSKWKEKHIKELHLIAGLLIIAVIFLV